jgi:tetratricopeptide (TPR) repeat protein
VKGQTWAKAQLRHLNGLFSLFAVVGALTLLTTSCSWITKRRTLFNNDNPEEQTVPKSQYDQLLEKYQAAITQQEGTPAQIAAAQGVSSEQVDLVQELNKVSPGSGDLVETVDVFPDKMQSSAAAVVQYDDQRVRDDMQKLESGRIALDENKFDAALKSLKEAETSPARSVAVRAKFLLGEMLFRQGEFDLALQIFEEILAKDAFSSVVLSALGRLVVCAEKLKLAQKKERYHSLLHDFLANKG